MTQASRLGRLDPTFRGIDLPFLDGECFSLFGQFRVMPASIASHGFKLAGQLRKSRFVNREMGHRFAMRFFRRLDLGLGLVQLRLKIAYTSVHPNQFLLMSDRLLLVVLDSFSFMLQGLVPAKRFVPDSCAASLGSVSTR